jgi:hypothetical protein
MIATKTVVNNAENAIKEVEMPNNNANGRHRAGYGRGSASCGRHYRQRLRLRDGSCRQPGLTNDNPGKDRPGESVYDFTNQALSERKNDLEKELNWIKDRLDEQGDTSENSHPLK